MLRLRQAAQIGTWTAIAALLIGLPALIFISYGTGIGDIRDNSLISKLYLLIAAGALGTAGGLTVLKNSKIGGGLLIVGAIVSLIGTNAFSIAIGALLGGAGVIALTQPPLTPLQKAEISNDKVVPWGCLVALGVAVVLAILVSLLFGDGTSGVFSKVISGFRP